MFTCTSSGMASNTCQIVSIPGVAVKATFQSKVWVGGKFAHPTTKVQVHTRVLLNYLMFTKSFAQIIPWEIYLLKFLEVCIFLFCFPIFQQRKLNENLRKRNNTVEYLYTRNVSVQECLLFIILWNYNLFFSLSKSICYGMYGHSKRRRIITSGQVLLTYFKARPLPVVNSHPSRLRSFVCDHES